MQFGTGISGDGMAKQSVGLLGLGTMGAGMAANLLKAGFPLAVYNRSRAKAEAFAAQGARLAETPADAARGANVVLSMLADDAASRAVWLGTDGASGALAAAANGAVLVESSTVTPAWIAELAEAARARGLTLLDAPVTGSRAQAAAGQLSFLVGGPREALEAVRPVLETMSKEIVPLGPVGSGAKLKLINNFLCGVQIASLAEGMVWLERSGLDPFAVLRAVAREARRVREQMVNRDRLGGWAQLGCIGGAADEELHVGELGQVFCDRLL